MTKTWNGKVLEYLKEKGISTSDMSIQLASRTAQEVYQASMRLMAAGNVREAMNLVYPFYFEVLFSPSVKMPAMAFLGQRIEKYNPSTVLDMGCGNGIHACFLATTFPSITFIGSDISDVGIEIAKVRAIKEYDLGNVNFHTSAHLELEQHFGQKMFDFVLCDGALTDENEEAEFQMVSGILKPDGIFINFFGLQDLALQKKIFAKRAGLMTVESTVLMRWKTHALCVLVFQKK